MATHCYCGTSLLESLAVNYKCGACSRLFHIDCLKRGSKPSPLEGDHLFDFTCINCSHDGEEHFSRLKLQWVHVVSLALYNLQLRGGGKCGFFRWREHICNFIDKHWTTFFGFSKKKTSTWHGTVAGTLSAGCPKLFISGASKFKEPGWWALVDPHPPTRQDLEIALHGAGRFNKMSSKKQAAVDDVKPAPNNQAFIEQNAMPNCEQTCVSTENNTVFFGNKYAEPFDDIHETSTANVNDTNDLSMCDLDQLLAEKEIDLLDLETSDLDVDPGSPISLSSMSTENIFNDACTSSKQQKPKTEDGVAILEDSMTSNVEPAIKTNNEAETKDDEEFAQSENDDFCVVSLGKYDEKLLLQQLEHLLSVVKNNPVANRLRRKLIIRKLKQERNLPTMNLDEKLSSGLSHKKKLKLSSDLASTVARLHGHKILDRYHVVVPQVREQKWNAAPFITKLVGRRQTEQNVISPYTGRVLKPYIWQDFESKPPKLCLLEEIISYRLRKNNTGKPLPKVSLDYCYVQPQHIPTINSLCQQFFWEGIDMSESLHYPDFSCVVLYKKVIIGFAFMVPDVKYNEAYISFVFTHPEWRNAGIATFMLYHLIQTCMGKDVTLHVSATNSALFLYQKFGFKVEEFIVDFYDKYYPEDSKECRHAMFLRLSR